MTYSDDQQKDEEALRLRIMHGRYMHPDDSFRPVVRPSTIDVLSVTPVETAPSPALEPVPEKRVETPPLRRRSLFSAIIEATVQVDKVTRQSVQTVKHTFEPPHISAMRSHRQKQLVRGFYLVGSMSFLFALVLGVSALTKAGNSDPVTSKSVLGAHTANPNDATRNSEYPSENIPTSEDISTYLVAPQYPRYLRIPAIHVLTRIRRLGLDSKGAVATPNNINDAGWYDASVKPGDKDGASIIEGHVAGPTQHGVFWDLNKLAYGDKIEVDKGSGEVVSYKVVKIEKVAADRLSMNAYLSNEVLGKHDLKLITAAGKYNIINGVYDTRLVVYAQQTP